MRIEFTFVDDAGNNYQGTAELKPVVKSIVKYVRPLPAGKTDAKGLPARILGLRENGLFHEPRTAAEVHAKLQESYYCLPSRVQMALLRLWKKKRDLRRAVKRIGDRDEIAYVW
jgi:hypothetical protein